MARAAAFLEDRQLFVALPPMPEVVVLENPSLRAYVPLALYHDGRFAVTGGADNKLRVWCLATAACMSTFEGDSSSLDAVAMTPDGRFVLSGGGSDWRRGSADRRGRVWELDGDLDADGSMPPRPTPRSRTSPERRPRCARNESRPR